MAPGGEAQEHAREDTEELARLCRTIVSENAEGRLAVDGNGNDVIVNARDRNVIASYTMRNAKLYARLKFDHLVPDHIEEIARTSSVGSVLLDDLRTHPTSKTPTLMCFSSQRSCCNFRKNSRPCVGVPCLACEKKDIACSHYDDPVPGAYQDWKCSVGPALLIASTINTAVGHAFGEERITAVMSIQEIISQTSVGQDINDALCTQESGTTIMIVHMLSQGWRSSRHSDAV